MTPEGLDKLREFLPDCAISPPDGKNDLPPSPSHPTGTTATPTEDRGEGREWTG
jgi:hypothetical protein